MENVLISGASSGIGYELARQFASNEYNIIAVARNLEALLNLKKELEQEHNIKVHVFKKNLNNINEIKSLINELDEMKLKVNILINNAGFGYVNEFIEEDYEKDNEMINLNINALTYMTKIISKRMIRQKSGKILNVASTGAYCGGPYTAVYYATKAYVLSFSEALNVELKPYNILVSTLCPGATKTNFAKNAGRKENVNARRASYVAQKAYKGLLNNKSLIIPGIENKLFILIPRRLVILFVGKYQKSLKIRE